MDTSFSDNLCHLSNMKSFLLNWYFLCICCKKFRKTKTDNQEATVLQNNFTESDFQFKMLTSAGLNKNVLGSTYPAIIESLKYTNHRKVSRKLINISCDQIWEGAPSHLRSSCWISVVCNRIAVVSRMAYFLMCTTVFIVVSDHSHIMPLHKVVPGGV